MWAYLFCEFAVQDYQISAPSESVDITPDKPMVTVQRTTYCKDLGSPATNVDFSSRPLKVEIDEEKLALLVEIAHSIGQDKVVAVYTTSAKTGKDVDEIFHKLAHTMVEQVSGTSA